MSSVELNKKGNQVSGKRRGRSRECVTQRVAQLAGWQVPSKGENGESSVESLKKTEG